MIFKLGHRSIGYAIRLYCEAGGWNTVFVSKIDLIPTQDMQVSMS